MESGDTTARLVEGKGPAHRSDILNSPRHALTSLQNAAALGT
jgi:hypothetical protein